MYRVGRLAMVCVLLAILLLTGPAGVAQAGQAAQDAQAASVRVRIGVTADGIVRLAPSDLATAGVDPATVDPRTFALSSMDQPVAIRVTGEVDGRFDGADLLTFFGQKFRGTEFQEKYTDERVYWLDIGGTAGLRIADVDATHAGISRRRRTRQPQCMRNLTPLTTGFLPRRLSMSPRIPGFGWTPAYAA